MLSRQVAWIMGDDDSFLVKALSGVVHACHSGAALGLLLGVTDLSIATSRRRLESLNMLAIVGSVQSCLFRWEH